MKVLKSNQLRGKYHCSMMKKLQEKVPVQDKSTSMIDNSIITKQILQGFLTGEFLPAEFPELVDEGLGECLSEEIKKKKVEMLSGRLRRYARAERRPGILAQAKELPIDDDYSMTVKPDIVFVEPGRIEAVIFFPGKPFITQNGTKQDLSVQKCPEIYGLYLYAKSMLQPGETKVIRGSYYFMRKSTDTSKGMMDPDFFSGDGGNVVYFEKVVTYGDNTLNEQEEDYIQQIRDSDQGLIECTEEDCKTCRYDMICNYNKVPELFEKKTVQKRTLITLSDEQKQIVSFREGYARVIATAGSGKTECISERVAQMIKEGTNPSEFLLVTFTDAAAAEMQKRIAGKCLAYGLEVSPDDINASTFNALANAIDQENFEILGFNKEPSVIDDVHNRRIIADMINEPKVSTRLANVLDYANFDANTVNLKGALICVEKTFDIIKTKHLDLSAPGADDNLAGLLREAGIYRFMGASISTVSFLINLFGEYQKRLLEDGIITFADQEPMMFEVLKAIPGYLNKFGFKHIIVDEFQDSNDIQMEIIKEFTKCPSFESLMVVGDDSQSIYAFRDTSPDNMINFFKKLGHEGIDINLSINRRSTPEILKFAADIEGLNKERIDKPMNPAKDHGEPVHVAGFYSKDEEIEFIVKTVKEVLDSGRIPEDIAVLSYTKAELVSIGTELTKAGIPWVMMNPMPLSENSRVKAAISLADAFYQPDADKLYLDYLAAKYDGNILDELTFEEINTEKDELKKQFMNIDSLQIPFQRQIFHQMLENIKGTAEDEIYQYFLDLLYAEEDLQSELEFVQDFKIYGKDCCKKMEQQRKGVVLTTAHSSKGLEWPVVINTISKYDNKHFHSMGNKVEKEKEIEERRRLLFVSVTRAKDVLYVTGQYTAYSTKEEGNVYNTFLKEVFDVTGTKYVPIDPDAAAKKAARLKAKSSKIENAGIAKKPVTVKPARDTKFGKSAKSTRLA